MYMRIEILLIFHHRAKMLLLLSGVIKILLINDAKNCSIEMQISTLSNLINDAYPIV